MMAPLLAGLRLVIALALAGWAWRVVVVRHPPEAPPPPSLLRAYGGGVTALFALTFGWQAFWTLRPEEVVAFRQVERYDPRAWRLDSPTDRREVVDRQGQPLIVNEVTAGGVVRTYPAGPAAAHLTGYFSRRFGKAGLEAAVDDELAVWREPAWMTLGHAVEGTREPAPLRLTIDLRLQLAAARALGERRGAVVVVNPVQGDLLALVSGPSFAPAAIAEDSFAALAGRADSPLLNRALHGLYPPGSTFKPFVAAAALVTGLPADTTFTTDPAGYLPAGDTDRIRELAAGTGWSGFGPLTMEPALVRSANGYFAQLGVRLGPRRLRDAFEAFGLAGAPALPGVSGPELRPAAGRFPAGALKPGDTARVAIGQHGLLVTPLGLALATGALANYGRLAPPRLLLASPPASGRLVVEPTTAETVQRMMVKVVADPLGTGHGLRLPGVAVAAKTGSAENPHGAAHGWVIAFAPAEAATVALAVVVENGGTGGGSAAPIARAVLQAAAAAGYLRGDAS